MMRIYPIGAESLGTRSFCFFIETVDVRILIDPSVSLGPVRYGFKPHLQELAASHETREVIRQLAPITDVIVQTHYHADHLTLGVKRVYEFTDQEIAREIYQNKIILAKDLNTVSYNQRKRGYWLWKRGDLTITSADGTSFNRGKTCLKFSCPVSHGIEGSRTGKVIQVMIKDGNSGESCLVTSDVNGPGTDDALKFIIENQPETCFLDGPSTYHPKVTAEELELAAKRLAKLVEKVPNVIIDHHFLRDLNWQEWWENNVGTQASCVADYIGIPVENLEARRDALHEEQPVSKELHKGLSTGKTEVLKQISIASGKLSSSTYWKETIRELTIRNEA